MHLQNRCMELEIQCPWFGGLEVRRNWKVPNAVRLENFHLRLDIHLNSQKHQPLKSLKKYFFSPFDSDLWVLKCFKTPPTTSPNLTPVCPHVPWCLPSISSLPIAAVSTPHRVVDPSISWSKSHRTIGTMGAGRYLHINVINGWFVYDLYGKCR